MSLATRTTIIVVALATAAWSGLVIGRVTMEPPVTPVASAPIMLTEVAVQASSAANTRGRDFSIRAGALLTDRATTHRSTADKLTATAAQRLNGRSEGSRAPNTRSKRDAVTRAATPATRTMTSSSRPKINVSVASRPAAAKPTYKKVSVQVQSAKPVRRSATNTTSHAKKAPKQAKKSKPPRSHRR